MLLSTPNNASIDVNGARGTDW